MKIEKEICRRTKSNKTKHIQNTNYVQPLAPKRLLQASKSQEQILDLRFEPPLLERQHPRLKGVKARQCSRPNEHELKSFK